LPLDAVFIFCCQWWSVVLNQAGVVSGAFVTPAAAASAASAAACGEHPPLLFVNILFVCPEPVLAIRSCFIRTSEEEEKG